jgi:hypothetical protein
VNGDANLLVFLQRQRPARLEDAVLIDGIDGDWRCRSSWNQQLGIDSILAELD